MEPRPYIKVSVGGLGLRIPVASKASRTGVHSASSPCFCEISLPSFPVQTVPVTLLSATSGEPDSRTTAASFYLDEPALQKLLFSRCLKASVKRSFLKVVVVTGRQGSCCGVRAGKKLGSFKIPVTVEWSEGSAQLHSGWTVIGKSKPDGGSPGAQLHLNVKVEPDPRYVFQFDGEPSMSPQIVQVHGNMRQPIFSCKFSRDRGSRTRLGQVDLSSLNGYSKGDCNKNKERKERKGWLIMIHDLSGSAVAAASMVTPFVPSSGSDLVSRTNPGAWLILRPDSNGVDLWRPWGRLEAWRERTKSVGIGCRFQMNEGAGLTGVSTGRLISETILNAQRGGEFLIDTGRLKPDGSSPVSPVDSPKSSGEFSFTHVLPAVGGFVFQTNVKGENRSIKPIIQLAMRHVTCVEDAAVFMALAAAVDLSVDACQPFNRKLRAELSQPPVPP